MTFQEIVTLYEQAKKIFDSDITWELKYDLIFSLEISKKVSGKFEWYDPDTSYEEDVTYYMNAFGEYVEQIKKLL